MRTSELKFQDIVCSVKAGALGAGLVVGLAAGLAAMTPLAFAADGALNTSDKKITVTPTYEATKPAPDKKSLSYAIGLTTGRQLVKDGVELDMDTLIQGVRDGVEDKNTMLTEGQVRELMNDMVTSMRQRFVANKKVLEENNRKAGDAFRAKFAKEPNVRSLPDGVLIQELQTAKGPIPNLTDSVTVRYRGTLVNGKEFDASPEGKPVSFGLSRVITGWRQAIAQMPVGSHWKVVIPPEQAYGDRGIGTGIGPNETLIFDLYLDGAGKSE